jgi:hypothetical protein
MPETGNTTMARDRSIGDPRIEPMRDIGFKEGQQIEVFPDCDELAVAEFTDKYDGQFEGRAWSWFVRRRRRPPVGNDSLMHIFPAEFRPLGIREDVRGFDAQSLPVRSSSDRSCRQLPDLIQSAERFPCGLYDLFAVRSKELYHAIDIVGDHCIGHGFDEVSARLRSHGASFWVVSVAGNCVPMR